MTFITHFGLTILSISKSTIFYIFQIKNFVIDLTRILDRKHQAMILGLSRFCGESEFNTGATFLNQTNQTYASTQNAYYCVIL